MSERLGAIGSGMVVAGFVATIAGGVNLAKLKYHEMHEKLPHTGHPEVYAGMGIGGAALLGAGVAMVMLDNHRAKRLEAIREQATPADESSD